MQTRNKKIIPKKIPAELQGILWSVNVKNLDLEKDKVYIIHQILSYGSWNALKWLFSAYRLKTIQKTFTNYPQKTYTISAFNFAKNILLQINKNLSIYKYEKTSPRHI